METLCLRVDGGQTPDGHLAWMLTHHEVLAAEVNTGGPG